MRIATISEGQTEFACLPLLFPQVKNATGDILLNPLYAQIPPKEPVHRIVRECVKALRVASVSKPDLVLILIDREDANSSAGSIGAEIERGIKAEHSYAFAVRVVVKDRMFENWLIADVDALAAQPKRFEVTEALRRRVQPNKADRVAALELMKKAARNGQYDKVADGKRTAAHLDLLRAGQHSRSLRHFLHVLGHPAYQEQCARPS